MIKGKQYKTGITIDKITTCDFDKLNPVYNEDILKMARDGKSDERLIQFIAKKMGIHRRYHSPPNVHSTHLAQEALEKLIKENPSILEEAEFVILAGISNPMPSVCTSALLSGDLGFKNASCWDIKSGCSTGVLGLMQALDWFNLGAKTGVLVCTETLTKFANPHALQMSAATGDGACAMILRASNDWQVRGIVHGTDPKYFRSILVKGTYPVDINNYNPDDYVFSFDDKSDALEKMAFYWQNSLKELLELSGVSGDQINHYIAHQVDGTKNKLFAKSQNIPDEAIALNFKDYGNMGCPTVFINYWQWINRPDHKYAVGDNLVIHAVGGGLSWAGICLTKIS
ncbi:MAG: hypothetical protein ISR65_05415 [Bacteriovoracaceae bacterium]|nr:hypothetical protein [Bacteriovoracaceae bacterium]